MTHGSLFSGIGGFDLAAQWMGWENVFHCEWNEFGQRILKFYWPNAISYHDITKTDFTIHRGRIDVLTGGFPCQPYSTAGKRLGKDDDRHLWPEMLRAIREIAPRWVVGENVLGLVNWNGGLVFDEVQADLEAEGYEVQPFVLPACAVNAPHRRDRVWFVAHANFGNDRRTTGENAGSSREKGIQKRDEVRQPIKPSKVQRNASDTNGNGHELWGLGEDRSTEGEGETDEQKRERFWGDDWRIGQQGNAPYTSYTGLQGSEKFRGIGAVRTKRNKQPSGRIPPTWQKFPTQSPICFGDDGLPTELDGITFSKWRNESIKAAGNAIVPQVVLQIFKAIEQYEMI